MKYEIIEDCSPYYIRYTHAGIQDVLDYSNECTPDISILPKNFTHYPLGIEKASKMLSMIPTSKHFPFEKKECHCLSLSRVCITGLIKTDQLVTSV